MRGGGQGAVPPGRSVLAPRRVRVELYRYATDQANAMGWVLHLDIKGHRVSDFPHAIYKGGNLGDFDQAPNAGVWILEIQIAHPQRPFGAFYEDLLI